LLTALRLEIQLSSTHGSDPSRLDCPAHQSNSLVAMEVETKFLRLFKPAALSDRIGGWRVYWIGGWDKCHVLFVVMVERPGPVR
jgi:hypothetical protein